MIRIRISLVLFSLLLLNSCNLKKSEDTNHYVKLVKTASVVEISSISQKTFPSVIEEAEEVNLAFRVSGPILEMDVKEGDFVEKGQLVAQMDPRDYKVQQIAAETQVKQLRSEYARVAELNKRESVTDNEYEKMKAGKEMAEAKLKNTNDQLADTKLYAPFSGYISKVNFENGEMVNHGTAVVSMVDISVLKAEIDVPASFYINRDSIIGFECTQEDLPGVVYPFVLYANNVKANNNGLYTLYLYHKPKPGCQLAPGMNVSVSVGFANFNQDQLSIPISALFKKDNKNFVWIVNDDLTVNEREIVAGSAIRDACINIVSGLTKGEQVVVGGLNLLKEGEKVRVVKPKSPTNIGNLL